MKEAKICDRCGKVVKPGEMQHRLSITKSISFGYLPVTPIRSIDLCSSCINDVIKFIVKAPKEDNNDSKGEL